MERMTESDVKKITVEYNDGTTKEIEKVVLCDLEKCDTEGKLNFEMLNCSGEDLYAIVYGFMGLGVKLGFFDEEEVAQ